MSIETLYEDLGQALGEAKRDAGDLLRDIKKRLGDRDGVVQVTTALRSWVFTHKHRNMFRLSKDGKSVLMQRGRNWDDISYAKVQFGRYQ
jgi:hypothetical protein